MASLLKQFDTFLLKILGYDPLHTQMPTAFSKAPPQTSCEHERRSSMSEQRLPSVRTNVRDYLCACEHLLASAVTPTAPRFSNEELELLEYYATEIAENILLLQVQKK